MQTIDRLSKSSFSGDLTEKTPEASFRLCQRLIRQALRDLSDQSPEISFDSATYFIDNQHLGFCNDIGINHDELRTRVIACLKETGVRRKRMVNDLIEDFNGANSAIKNKGISI